MRKTYVIFGLIVLVVSISASEMDSVNSFLIVGEIRTSVDNGVADSKSDITEPTEFDWADASVIVTHEVTNSQGDKTVDELSSGNFVDGHVSLVGEIDHPTYAKISISNSQDITRSLNVLLVPGNLVVHHFALLDHLGSHPNEVVLVGASRSTTNQNSMFSISGTYEPQQANTDHKFLSAHLTAEEYYEDGTLNVIDYGKVLLDQNYNFLVEADVDEPRVAQLEIAVGTSVLVRKYVVIEPKVEIKVQQYHKVESQFVVATSETGRHAKLLDSWQLQDEFVTAWDATIVASKSGSSSKKDGSPTDDFTRLFNRVFDIQLKNLKRFALEEEDPLNRLLALELARKILPPGTIKYQEIIELYDQFAKLLDSDVVARRVTPARNRIAAFLTRTENNANLVVGNHVPEFSLANHEGELISLKQVVEDNSLILIDFWAIWCGPCIAAFEPLKELHEAYKNRGFEVVSIAVDTSIADWKEISKEYELPWIDLRASGDLLGSTAVAYGIQGLPTTYLIDSENRIIHKNIKPDELSNFLKKHYD
ncbi:MAG: TlpA family protein disulfide reductase [Gammaproteobacteria bacterium]|nr:TlpA family protein disulfide reductase [Gammaproteobacteria bacterium]